MSEGVDDLVYQTLLADISTVHEIAFENNFFHQLLLLFVIELLSFSYSPCQKVLLLNVTSEEDYDLLVHNCALDAIKQQGVK